MERHHDDREAIPVTAREAAVLAALDDAGRRAATGSPLRRVAAAARTEWRQGRIAGPDLLGPDAYDVDARLWVVRLGALAALSRLAAPAGLPHAALLRLGDPTPDGWAAAVRAGAEAAAAAGAARPDRDAAAGATGRSATVAATAPEIVTVLSRDEALSVLAADRDATAPDPWQLRFPAAEGELRLQRPRRLGLPLPPEAGGFGCLVTWRSPVRVARELVSVVPSDWRALAALVAGVHALDRLALPPATAGPARAILLRTIVALVREAAGTPRQAAGRRAVETAVAMLDRIGAGSRVARPGAHARPGPTAAWTWPAAFALVAAGLERLAGPGLEPLVRRPAAGTWVEVVDEEAGRLLGAGPVAAPEQLPRRRGTWPRRRVEAPPGTVPVRLAEGVEAVPLAALRTPLRAQLLGGPTG